MGRSPLKVAIVAPPWFELPPPGYGGIEWICYLLAEGLVERGHDVTLIGAGPPNTRAKFISTGQPASERLGDPILELTHVARAAATLRSEDFDVIHDHTLSGPLLSFDRMTPTVLTAHGPINDDFAAYYSALPNIFLVAISHSQRKSRPHLPWVGTVHNAVSVREYPERARKEDFVLFLGRMNADKGAHLAIDAASKAGYPIVLAAKCNEPQERAYFEAEIKPRLGPGVEWIGEADTSTKMDLLSRARCLVFPIQWEEPFGIVMVEALAAGTPVVATRRGSVPEVIVDGETGFICDEVSQLPEAIQKAADLEPSACRRDALRRFDVDHMVAGYEQVYRAVAQFGRRVAV
ncbi:MAG: glycosyltransferase family 4 protein [Actinomycetota bacterium]|nr:glycosyltransferase family 4 protein [Actinomycetota bacterium]